MASTYPSPCAGPVRLAVLGCGAVTEHCHLPAAQAVADIAVTVLVDRDRARAEALARRFHVPHVGDTLEPRDPKADAILIALPNHLHAPVAIRFLREGIPVLVEKPMATSAADARAMVHAAAIGGVPLQVGLVKRFAPGARVIQDALESGLVGTLTGFSIEWGEKFDWPLRTDAGMARDAAVGGVLLDFGSHLLDLLCWWLGEPELASYRDDARGGVEADCELELSMTGLHGRVRGIARFSRLRRLDNAVRIAGDRATLEWDHDTPAHVRLLPHRRGATPGRFVWDSEHHRTESDPFAAQLRAFAQAVRTGVSPVPGTSVLPSIDLTEACYRRRVRMPDPWECPVGLRPGS